MTRSPSQQKIWDLLPWTSTGQKEKHFEGLCDLPDDVCDRLVPLVSALNSGGCFEMMQAKTKIKKILNLSPEELDAAIAQVRAKPVNSDADPHSTNFTKTE